MITLSIYNVIQILIIFVIAIMFVASIYNEKLRRQKERFKLDMLLERQKIRQEMQVRQSENYFKR